MTAAAKWRSRVFGDGEYTPCVAQRHDIRCRGIAEHAHHIVYRSHLDPAKHYTVTANGAPLSRVCHDLAHETHNGNLPPHLVEAAQRAVA